MINRYNNTFAYVCSICSVYNFNSLNLFDFSGKDGVKLVCDSSCGEYCVYINKKNDKYKIDVACVICGDFHSYIVPCDKLWTKKLKIFNCTATGLGIFFVGSREDVDIAIAKQEKSTQEDSFLSGSFDNLEEKDDSIVSMVVDIIQAMIVQSKVRCKCGVPNVRISINDGGIIVLKCNNCGTKKKINTDSRGLDELIMNDYIQLK